MGALLGAAGVLVCVLFVYDLAWEPLLQQSYLDWYVDNGGLVNLVLGLVAVGAKLDERPECISADPDRYFQAWGGLLGDSLSELGRALRRGTGAGGSRPLAVPLLDSALTLVFALVWGPLLLAFLLVIAPAQYLVFLVAGAPARIAVDRAEDRPAPLYALRPVTFTAAIAAVVLFVAGHAA